MGRTKIAKSVKTFITEIGNRNIRSTHFPPRESSGELCAASAGWHEKANRNIAIREYRETKIKRPTVVRLIVVKTKPQSLRVEIKRETLRTQMAMK